MGDNIREFSSHYSGENLYGFFKEEISREVAGIIEKKPKQMVDPLIILPPSYKVGEGTAILPMHFCIYLVRRNAQTRYKFPYLLFLCNGSLRRTNCFISLQM